MADSDRTDAEPAAPESEAPAAPNGDTPTGPETGGADLARRRFFRQFAGDFVQGAVTVVGAAQALQRASAEAASAILDPQAYAPAAPVPPPSPTGFRAAFREADGVLYVIDQRKLPESLEEFPIKSAAMAAATIREMIVRGAPAIGQVAAIGMGCIATPRRAVPR